MVLAPILTSIICREGQITCGQQKKITVVIEWFKRCLSGSSRSLITIGSIGPLEIYKRFGCRHDILSLVIGQDSDRFLCKNHGSRISFSRLQICPPIHFARKKLQMAKKTPDLNIGEWNQALVWLHSGPNVFIKRPNPRFSIWPEKLVEIDGVCVCPKILELTPKWINNLFMSRKGSLFIFIIHWFFPVFAIYDHVNHVH